MSKKMTELEITMRTLREMMRAEVDKSNDHFSPGTKLDAAALQYWSGYKEGILFTINKLNAILGDEG